MDNTCRDNKNKYTLMFMFLMVEFGVFEKVLHYDFHCVLLYNLSDKNGISTSRTYA